MSRFLKLFLQEPNQLIVAYDNNEKKQDSVYSKRIKAGKRRTYFFDIKATRSNDYYLTITESRKKFNEEGYDRHKIFVYKEDFNKFIEGLTDAVDHVKTQLMPDFDFDSFNHEYDEEYSEVETTTETTTIAEPSIIDQIPSSSNNLASENVDKW